MKKYFTLLCLLPFFASSQNLLSNGGFEQYSVLPSGYCEWNDCVGWSNVNGTTNCGAYGTPDYYSTNSTAPVKLPKIANGDSINPHGGDAIMGFITRQVPPNIVDYREYIMTMMNTPMAAGTTYQVSFYLSNAYFPTYGYGSNNIGIRFSNSPLHQATYEVINVVPQLEIDTIVYTNNWVYFQFNYTADSAYQYITIGNFKADSVTLYQNFNHTGNIAYYFIDDIDIEANSVLPPVAAFTASDSVICQYSCINYQNLSTNATAWQWTFAGANPPTSTAQNPQSICYTDTGSYNATLIASNAGGSDTITFTDYIKVRPAPPAPDITRSNDTLYSSTDTSYISYQWYADTSLIPGATDSILVVANSGNYNLKVTSSNGCSTATGTNIILGMQPALSSGIRFIITPNPADGEFIISGMTFTGTALFNIYNMLGEKVYSKQMETGKLKQETIDISNLSKGVYFAEIVTENDKGIIKLVKE